MAGGAASIGAFFATLGLKSEGWVRGAKDAENATEGLGSSAMRFAKGGMLAMTAGLAAGGYAAWKLTDRVLNLAEGVNELSAQTGVGTDLIQAIRGAMVQATGTAQQADLAIRTLTRGIGEMRATGRGPLVEVIGALGLTPDRIAEGEAGARQIINALIALEDQQVRTGIASKVFGEAGGSLAVVLASQRDGVDGLVRQQRRLGQIISSDSLPALGAMSEQVDVLKAAFDGLLVQGVAEFLAGFQGLDQGTGGIEEISAALQETLVPALREAGEEVGRFIKTLELLNDTADKVRAVGTIFSNPGLSLSMYENVTTAMRRAQSSNVYGPEPTNNFAAQSFGFTGGGW
jgi:hypothetical protein